MAITTHPAEYATPAFELSPKTAMAAFYILIGIVAICIAVPAALATADANLFEECYSNCARATAIATN